MIHVFAEVFRPSVIVVFLSSVVLAQGHSKDGDAAATKAPVQTVSEFLTLATELKRQSRQLRQNPEALKQLENAPAYLRASIASTALAQHSGDQLSTSKSFDLQDLALMLGADRTIDPKVEKSLDVQNQMKIAIGFFEAGLAGASVPSTREEVASLGKSFGNRIMVGDKKESEASCNAMHELLTRWCPVIV